MSSVSLSGTVSVALDALIVPSVSSGNPQQDTHAAVSENRSHTSRAGKDLPQRAHAGVRHRQKPAYKFHDERIKNTVEFLTVALEALRTV